MRIKAAFLIGGAVGYVLGTRAGRERFEKIRSGAQTVWENPRVQGTVTDATSFVKEKAPDLTEKVGGAVKQATDAVKSRTAAGEQGEQVGDSYETSTEDLSGTPTTGGTTTNGTGSH